MRRMAMAAVLMAGVAVLVVTAAGTARAGQIGFEEEYALAKDRGEALKQLIPGTEEHYYYTCLYYQNTGQFDKVEEMLDPWIKRYGNTGQVEEIRNRQALLTYDAGDAAKSKKTLDFLKWRLGLTFAYQREPLEKKSTLPTSLKADVISRETLTAKAMKDYKNLQGFESSAFEWLDGQSLDATRRRDLLSRLERPDYPNLPQLVAAELGTKESRGFGEFGVYGKMLLGQMDELVKLKPDVVNDSSFVSAYMTKLLPPDGVDWRHDAAAHAAYLDRLWKFVDGLAPAFNSLKACVMYQRLVLDRSQGVWDKDRFMTYIKLPRPMFYVNPKYLDEVDNRRFRVNMGARWDEVPVLAPIGMDEPLVRSYLMHFFVEAESWNDFVQYIKEDYLKPVFAETKIVNGVGDPEKWYSMLQPSEYQALQERVDIDFAYTNKDVFGPQEDVSLKVYVKNVKTLIVKVFEINARNYYETNGREVDTDINLDGLVANEERVETYDEVALRRVERSFPFPSLKERGVYIVEFVGNGKSSRALIRKGQLHQLVRTSVAGQVFTILDENNQALKDARLWVAGHEYEPQDNGTIVVPFTATPGRQSIVLLHGAFASLATYEMESENYQLEAGIHVDRESLLARQRAKVVIRPMLRINGTPAPLGVLENVTLVITSKDRDGVSTTKEVQDFKLESAGESAYEFRVPERLRAISFVVKAKVRNLSRAKDEWLTASQDFVLNGIEMTDKIADLHFSHSGGQYFVDVLGRSGESLAGRAVNFQLKHRDFTQTVPASLQSDEAGRIALGELKDIETVNATSPEGAGFQWAIPRDQRTYQSVIQGAAGSTLAVAYMGSAAAPQRDELSLLEERGSTFVADRFDALAIGNGLVELRNLPAGEYSLLLKRSGVTIKVRVAEGEVKDGYVLGKNQYLELAGQKPLQIVSVKAEGGNVQIQLVNSSATARVHVVATRYAEEYPLFDDLSLAMQGPAFWWLATPESVYVAGRQIGDEYQYIIDRKYARKYPGNMLTRPGLLLNPWAISKTETGSQVAAQGGEFEAKGAGRGGGGMRAPGRVAKRQYGTGVEEGFSSLEYLPAGSVVIANLSPDDKGVVTVPVAELGGHQQIHVLAVGPEETVYREIALAETKLEAKDLRLLAGPDPKGHFTEQKQISLVEKGGTFTIEDITASRYEVYDSIAKVYGLYATLSGDATLTEFQFVVGWPKLTDAEKEEKYSKYACHELHFFLYHKDPEFFKRVVEPYLKNKKDKTFMDRFLIGDDLSGYLRPWQFEQLNAVERVLLGQRIAAQQASLSRHMKDLWDLQPPDVDRFNYLFKTALQGSSLETADMAKLDAAVEQQMTAKKAESLARLGGLREDRSRSGAAGGPMAPAAFAAAKPESEAPAPAEEAAVAADGLMANRLKDQDESRMELRKQLAEKGKERNGEAAYGWDKSDVEMRRRARQLYQKLEKTEEWVENNYYHLPIEQQTYSLVPVNGFWKDYAAAGAGVFRSKNVAEASRNFTEMMLALAVLDLPMESPEQKTEFADAKMTLTAAGGPAIVFHKEVKPAEPAAEKSPILVSENFFRQGDRWRFVDNVKVEKYVTDEFLIETVYGCHVVVTNPTSARQTLDILLQIPQGSIAVLNGQATRSVHVELEPYRTESQDFFFYFPKAGQWPQLPVQVAEDEKLVASADAVTLNVVEKLSKIDTTSWDYISQHGSEEDVLGFLKQENLERVNLDRMAWRMKDKAFFDKAMSALGERHTYNQVLWSFGIMHNEPAVIRQFLQHADGFVSQCGAWIDTPLLVIDPVERKSYQFMEYAPLVNARAHKLGKKREILNDRFFSQYERLMTILRYRPALDADDRMQLTYYMLLQDRVEEGIEMLKTVDKAKLPTDLQYDYLQAYVGFYQADAKAAGEIAKKYEKYPVVRWRNLFANVLSQAAEIEGKATGVVDVEDRSQRQGQLAETEPTFEFKVESRKITMDYQNLTQCQVNYYLMDIELMFSREPFVQEVGGQFAYIRPNLSQTVKLPETGKTFTFDLPKQFESSNVLIEITAGGKTQSQAYYARSLAVQLSENYGQVKVTDQESGKPLPSVYVKVYARMKDGTVRFFKDGYTDLRGRFDYTSLNTNELDFVEKFALLVLSEKQGAVVREANPPKQ